MRFLYITVVVLIICVCISLETGISNGRKLPAMWPPPSSGEREELDQDVGGYHQDRATGVVLAEQWTGKG